jgi:hypothetical protein
MTRLLCFPSIGLRRCRPPCHTLHPKEHFSKYDHSWLASQTTFKTLQWACHLVQAGWTDGDGEIFSALWGAGPGSASCAVRGRGALLVVNKTDLLQRSVSCSSTEGGEGAAAGGLRVGANRVIVPSMQRPSFSSSGPPSREGSAPPEVSLPLVAREAFQHVVFTAAATGQGIDLLDRVSWLNKVDNLGMFKKSREASRRAGFPSMIAWKGSFSHVNLVAA